MWQDLSGRVTKSWERIREHKHGDSCNNFKMDRDNPAVSAGTAPVPGADDAVLSGYLPGTWNTGREAAGGYNGEASGPMVLRTGRICTGFSEGRIVLEAVLLRNTSAALPGEGEKT